MAACGPVPVPEDVPPAEAQAEPWTLVAASGFFPPKEIGVGKATLREVSLNHGNTFRAGPIHAGGGFAMHFVASLPGAEPETVDCRGHGRPSRPSEDADLACTFASSAGTSTLKLASYRRELATMSAPETRSPLYELSGAHGDASVERLNPDVPSHGYVIRGGGTILATVYPSERRAMARRGLGDRDVHLAALVGAIFILESASSDE